MKTVPIDDNFEMMLECAERYAIGRHSYLPPFAIAYITTFLPDISYRTLSVFRDDMKSNFAMFARMNWYLSYQKEWKDFHKAVCAELEKRKENEEIRKRGAKREV